MKSIVATKISKSFGDKKLFSDLSFDIEKGTITSIEGPSGCGKTTLLRILSGLDRPDNGSIKINEKKISFVFQDDLLCENFTALGNIRMVSGKTLSNSDILRHLEEVELTNINNKPVCDFSGGMKRRLSIVRAICYDADIIFMDEPFKGLDNDLKTKIMDYVKKYCKDKTLVFVTHDHSETQYMKADILKL